MFSLNPLSGPQTASWAETPHKEFEERVTAQQPRLTWVFYAEVGKSLDLTFVPEPLFVSRRIPSDRQTDICFESSCRKANIEQIKILYVKLCLHVHSPPLKANTARWTRTSTESSHVINSNRFISYHICPIFKYFFFIIQLFEIEQNKNIASFKKQLHASSGLLGGPRPFPLTYLNIPALKSVKQIEGRRWEKLRKSI